MFTCEQPFRKSGDHGLGPTTCGFAPTDATGGWVDSGADGEAAGGQPTNVHSAGEWEPERNPEDPQSAVSGAAV